MKQFQSPQESLGDLDAKTASTVISAAADVALIIDADGVVRDLAYGSASFAPDEYSRWVGQPWADIVTTESRPKVEALIHQASSEAGGPWRQVNHKSLRGAPVPVMYASVPIGDDGRVVAIGRDLSDVAALQQRLVHAQQSLERDYARLRQAEMRYRLLFQMTSEAVLVVDAATQMVTETNPAGIELLGGDANQIVGRRFPENFDRQGTQAVESLMATVRAVGRGDSVRAQSADGSREFVVSTSLFRQDQASYYLVRLSPVKTDQAGAEPLEARSTLCRFVENSPDGFIVTDPNGRVMVANRAFLDMAQLAVEKQATGESLERWLGRPGVDLKVLVNNLREHGSIRLFSTTLRGEHGSTIEVEVSAASVSDGDQLHFAFVIRNVRQRPSPAHREGKELPRSVEQLTELVGGVPLKEIVRESTDLIERLCIEAALELTGDNRASAAELLGLSRQSLYVKLRRYGLEDSGS